MKPEPKTKLTTRIIVCGVILLMTINLFSQTDTWVQKTDFGGTARYYAVGFSIGNKGYIGTGIDGARKRDFWEYDPVTDTWSQMADFGGTPRAQAVGFSIGTKGYIGTGNDGTSIVEGPGDGTPGIRRDFWEYDPAINTWAQKASLPASGRFGAVGFSIGDKGYIGTGKRLLLQEQYLRDFWEYDPVANTWTQKTNFGGSARYQAVGFSIGNKGYIGTGGTGVGTEDFWLYDPALDTWTQRANYAGSITFGAACFSISNKGFIGTGYAGVNQNLITHFWEYDPTIDTWTQRAPVSTTPRAWAVGFSVGSKGFIATGYTGNATGQVWEYTPCLSTAAFYRDQDNDGYGDPNNTTQACNAPSGYVDNNTDCNDANNAVHPGATEICNGIDDDCDGSIDEGVQTIFYQDADEDGYGNAAVSILACTAPAGYVNNSTDCNDANNAIHPGATEICNSIDDDCDGSIDEGVQSTFYQDADGDGYGNAAVTALACAAPPGYVNNNTDCNDANGTIHPGATEVCNGIDDDCDGLVDEGVQNIFYRDADNDGYGNAAVTILACTVPAGYVNNNTDCNDANNAVHPGAIEVCNGVDDDCDGLTDNVIPVTNPNTWLQKIDFGGTARSQAIKFTIGSKGYIGTGYDGTTKMDFWEYDPSSNTWSQKADFGGTARTRAVAFSIGSKGYVGTGIDLISGYKKDFWEYDPATNTWIQKADFGGAARHQAVGFTIGTKGYIGTGFDNNGILKRDFWEYNPSTNTWQQKTDFGGSSRVLAVGFSISNKGYIGTGFDINNITKKDFWEYDPFANTWIQKADFGGIARYSAAGFSIGTKGYLGTGFNDNDGFKKDFWEYDPSTNTWLQKADFGGTARSEVVGFSIGNKAYIGTGFDGVLKKDLWEYTPSSTNLVFYRDADNDNYGDPTNTVQACSTPSGYVNNNTDCNDANNAIHPGAIEICNNIDDDCDGLIDEGVQSTFYRDADGDGYGNASVTTLACTAPTGYVNNSTDCNDGNNAIHPGATEICNGVDDDCDGLIDEGVKITFYRDADGDGYGNSSITTLACTAPAGYVNNNTDCNDANNAIHPGVTEICNNIDDDCDGLIDEGVQSTFYRDADGDGFGNASVTTLACTAPAGYTNNNTDCNDASNAIHPGATEICNGEDEDCDGLIDEGVQSTFYRDADNDGYGNAFITTLACTAPAGYVNNNTDCNDANNAVHPGATEICNGIDDDCDALIDEGVKLTFYRDADGDGYGNVSITTLACTAPAGYVNNNTDCNDGNSAVHPGATEICNGIDDDCDGSVDEGVLTTFYRDADGDSYGNPSVIVLACSVPAGYVNINTDCNDANSAIHPGVTELCNGVDDDCDGLIDEGCPPSINIYDTIVMENAGAALVRVTLSQSYSQIVTVKYKTMNGTAKSPKDYSSMNSTLTFNPGEVRKYISVPIIADAIAEPNELFTIDLTLPNSSPATIADGTGIVTITETILVRSTKQQPLKEQNGENIKLIVPIPQHKSGRLRFYGIEPGSFDVVLTDVNGKLVAKLKNYSNDWSMIKLAPGLYFYQVIYIRSKKTPQLITGKLLIVD